MIEMSNLNDAISQVMLYRNLVIEENLKWALNHRFGRLPTHSFIARKIWRRTYQNDGKQDICYKKEVLLKIEPDQENLMGVTISFPHAKFRPLRYLFTANPPATAPSEQVTPR